MNYNEITRNEEILALIKKANANLKTLKFTDHSEAHTKLVAERAAFILKQLNYSEHDAELARIAGFMHDIGNAVNRTHHAEYGALIANDILKQTDMSVLDRLTVMSAISHHDESTGGAIDAISAALIIADKTDVRRNRVKVFPASGLDIHNRVNYAVTSNHITVDEDLITLHLEVDESICTMYEYFDIFLGRMMMSRQAAEMLNTKFSLIVNENKIL